MSHALELVDGEVSARIVKIRDAKKLEELLMTNRAWLRPWEATNPEGPVSFDIKKQIRALLRQMDNDQGLPFVICFNGQVVGQVNVANILWGSVSSAVIGYWIAPDFAGQNITPTAVALVSDYLMREMGLHRIEIDIRPENKASIRVVEKLGFRYEGFREKYIHINGAWRDHFSFALTKEEVAEGILLRWKRGRVPKSEYPIF
ncbi:GNAT family N-acetyltransferase [Candidatus Rhodoluna planktonica]|uniref:GCN5 family acetyltransferase n=1 Tax=Candidatus Rhodoluna planktonica TaxID=535712 RepID=A0A1D9DY68_9MICO|nr:GCN5 family acetyltransferase [Candidatus Rhodoluna planktonica]